MTEYYNLYPEDTSETQYIDFNKDTGGRVYLPGYIELEKGKKYDISIIFEGVEYTDVNPIFQYFNIIMEYYEYNEDGEIVPSGTILPFSERIEPGGPHLFKVEDVNRIVGTVKDGVSKFFRLYINQKTSFHTGSGKVGYKHIQINFTGDDLNWQGPEDIEGLVDLSNRFSPRVRSNGIGIYPVSQYQLADLFADLWSVGFIEGFFHDLLGDPLDGIISLRYYYGIKELIDDSSVDCYLTIGNVKFNGMVASETPIITKPAQSEFVEIDMGEVRVPEYHGNFLDNAPYTQVEIYIPFYGYYSMNATEVRGNSIKLTYNLNISTGVAVANVYRLNPDGDRYFLITSLDCDLGVDIPINITAMETLTNKVTQRAVEGGKALGGMAMGAVAGPAGAMAGSAMMGASQQSEPVSRKERIGQESQQTAQSSEMVMNGLNNVMEPSNFDTTVSSRHGGMSSETGSMSDFRPALFITRPIVKAPANYNQMVGKPDYSTGKVRDYSGYIKVGSITKGNHDIPRSVFEEIIKNLRGGVYVD